MDKLKILWKQAKANIPTVLVEYPEVCLLIFAVGFILGALLL